MPSRRHLLAAAGTASVASLAGCLDALAGGGTRTDYAGWLHEPRGVIDVDRHAVATLDVGAVRARRDHLSGEADDALGRLDRESESVDLADVDRLTALGYGDPEVGAAGLTLVADGRFDVEAIRGEMGVADSSLVTHEGAHGEFDLYAYEPSVFADLRRFRGPDQQRAPDLTLGLGVTQSTLVGGAVLHPEVRGLAAVRAAIDAGSGDAAGLTDGRHQRDLLAVVGDRPLATSLSRATVADLATRVEDPGTWGVLTDAAGLGAGYALGEERLRVALAAEPTDLADPDRVRSVLQDATDGDDGPSVEGVGVARGGRVVYADLAVSAERIAAAVDGFSLDGLREA